MTRPTSFNTSSSCGAHVIELHAAFPVVRILPSRPAAARGHLHQHSLVQVERLRFSCVVYEQPCHAPALFLRRLLGTVPYTLLTLPTNREIYNFITYPFSLNTT